MTRRKTKTPSPPDFYRILVVEDDARRVAKFKQWAAVFDDDIRFVWAKSVGPALGILARDEEDTYHGVMLDHDLHTNTVIDIEQGFDGRNVVHAVIENIRKDIPILVHSANRRFAPIMADMLAEAGFSHINQLPMQELGEVRFGCWLADVMHEAE